MLRIGICDDELNAREALRFALEKITDENTEQIVYEFSSGEIAVKWLSAHPGEIDLLFLDVEMKGINGMETARRIREFNSDILLVFVTSYADYVFDGYQVNALDYLLKPAEEDRLLQVLNRVRRQLSDREEEVFLLQNTDGTYRFYLGEIDYFYSSKRQVFLVSNDREYAFYRKLDEVEHQIPSFVRIHQRYLVNPAKVSHIGSTSLSLGSQTLPISRSLRESATRKLAQSMLNQAGGISL